MYSIVKISYQQIFVEIFQLTTVVGGVLGARNNPSVCSQWLIHPSLICESGTEIMPNSTPVLFTL
jgi:hypothetical protein